jgi:hypothetical protein
MTEALNRHLPERPRLRVPLRPRGPQARPRCRATLGSTLKPSSLPFEALKAMSENPALLKRFASLLSLLLGLVVVGQLPAAEAPAAAVPEAPKPVVSTNVSNPPAAAVVAPATLAAEAKPAAPAPTNATVAPSTASTPSSRERERSASSTAATNAPPGSFESFRLIAERNIFDPNRSPRVSRSSGGSEEPRRVPKIEAFALAGTMSFSNRHMAFFTSSSSQFQKALKPGDAIAGYQVAAVEIDHVKLEKDGAKVELKLNQQMRREDDGPWQISARAEMAASAPVISGSTPPAGGDAAPAAPAGASDALKRLMELRAKEQ